MGPPILADATPEVAPWITQASPYALLVAAVVILFRSFKAALEAQNWREEERSKELLALTREALGVIAANTATLNEVLKAVQESKRE